MVPRSEINMFKSSGRTEPTSSYVVQQVRTISLHKIREDLLVRVVKVEEAQ